MRFFVFECLVFSVQRVFFICWRSFPSNTSNQSINCLEAISVFFPDFFICSFERRINSCIIMKQKLYFGLFLPYFKTIECTRNQSVQLRSPIRLGQCRFLVWFRFRSNATLNRSNGKFIVLILFILFYCVVFRHLK